MKEQDANWRLWFRGPGPTVKSLIWLVVILVGLTGVLAIAYRVRRQLSPVEYEGKIVDKWVGYHNDETGATPYFRLVLESEDGRRTTVAVDQETFDRAKVGMRIRKSLKGIELNIAPGAGGLAKDAKAKRARSQL